jgi:hypothetical protein
LSALLSSVDVTWPLPCARFRLLLRAFGGTRSREFCQRKRCDLRYATYLHTFADEFQKGLAGSTLKPIGA